MNGTVAYVDFDGSDAQKRKLVGMRRYADAFGLSLVVVSERESRPRRLKARLKSMHPCGCIVECSAGRSDLPPEFFGDIPVVYLDGWDAYGETAVIVMHDNEATAKAAFRELVACRPSSLAVVGWTKDVCWTRIRERFFMNLSRRAGLRCFAFQRREESAASRRSRLAKWVRGLPSHCGVFAVNDLVAKEVLEACRASGRALPADLFVLGVDNNEAICGPCDVSSVQIDFEWAGYRAMDLLDRIRFKRHGKGARAVFGPLLVVRRRSTGGMGLGSQRVLDAVDLIRMKSCDGLRAEDVASFIGGSRRMAEMSFRAALGHSILAEIISVRMARACQLLRDRSVPLQSVALHSGFPSVAALRKSFRLRMGTSLLRWRTANTYS